VLLPLASVTLSRTALTAQSASPRHQGPVVRVLTENASMTGAVSPPESLLPVVTAIVELVVAGGAGGSIPVDADDPVGRPPDRRSPTDQQPARGSGRAGTTQRPTRAM
jgi:hypothetical protein